MMPAARGRAQVPYPGQVVPDPPPGDPGVPVVFTPTLYGGPANGSGPVNGAVPASGVLPHGVPPGQVPMAGPHGPNGAAFPVPPGFEPAPGGPPNGFPDAPPGTEAKLDAFFAADPSERNWSQQAGHEPGRAALPPHQPPDPAEPAMSGPGEFGWLGPPPRVERYPAADTFPAPGGGDQLAAPDQPVAGRDGFGPEPDPAPAADVAEGAGPRPGRSRHRSSRRRRQLPLWQEVPLLLFAAFLIAVLIRTFLLQAFYIPSGSMEHTLDIGDKVLVNKVVYDVRDPARGEIIVFRGTDRWAPEHKTPPTDLTGQIGRTLGDLVGLSQPGEKDFIKRVIGVPGDIVACCDAQGRVTVNGHPLDEPYIFENAPDDVPASTTECRSREFDPVTVPAGHVYVMGDHRLVSQDSRCQGPVPIENIIGRAFLVVWPASRWDTLDVPDGFNDVPKPYAAPAVAPYRPAGSAPVLFVGGIVVPLVWSSARRRRARGPRRRTLSG